MPLTSKGSSRVNPAFGMPPPDEMVRQPEGVETNLFVDKRHFSQITEG